MTNIKLIAIDLDGTLLDSQHAIRPHTISVLQQAVEEGIRVVVCTEEEFHVFVHMKHSWN